MLLDAVWTAAWSGYRYYHEWQDLGPEEQAYLIAAFQLKRENEALMQHELSESIKKASKKAKPS